MRSAPARYAPLGAALTALACATTGSGWMNDAESPSEEHAEPAAGARQEAATGSPDPTRFQTRVIGAPETASATAEPAPEGPGNVSFGGGGPRTPRSVPPPGDGRVLGTFRNTYYDFPSEKDFEGEAVPLKDARCESITAVPRGFFEAVCVQGSGILASGRPVSFAKRDCECAEVCPRTGQKICFEALDATRFPWGRGARGQPITPLLTVAVDDSVVPLGTALYVPEFEGLPTNAAGTAVHDGCFIAEDRGLRVKGQHLDVFTGSADVTALWNRLVPSNRGVTVVAGSPRCARAEAGTTLPAVTEEKRRTTPAGPKTRPASR